MNILSYFDCGLERDKTVSMPYIIAEAGVNHEGDIRLAKRQIEEASEAGANAIKFQSYRASTIASKNSPAYWDTNKEPTTSQYELFSKYDSFWKAEFEQLKVHCDSNDIEFMSTPFDVESALFLSELVNVFKVSSSDITNRPFIEYICGFGKPIILSTGASDLDEIDEALDWIDKYHIPVALLHCVLNYPTLDHNAHLGMIKGLIDQYPERVIGYSDHTLPQNMKALEVATLLGAEILEKHFTHDKSLPGNDHYHAMDKHDLTVFIINVRHVIELLGRKKKQALESESLARQNARRSLVAARFIESGSQLQLEDLTWKRPATGISPKEIGRVLNRVTLKNLEEDEILTWDVLK